MPLFVWLEKAFRIEASTMLETRWSHASCFFFYRNTVFNQSAHPNSFSCCLVNLNDHQDFVAIQCSLARFGTFHNPWPISPHTSPQWQGRGLSFKRNSVFRRWECQTLQQIINHKVNKDRRFERWSFSSSARKAGIEGKGWKTWFWGIRVARYIYIPCAADASRMEDVKKLKKFESHRKDVFGPGACLDVKKITLQDDAQTCKVRSSPIHSQLSTSLEQWTLKSNIVLSLATSWNMPCRETKLWNSVYFNSLHKKPR